MMRENIAAMNALTTFVLQEGLMVEDAPPKINEPYYDKYIAFKMASMGLSYGDTIELDLGHTKIKGKLLWKVDENTTHIRLLTQGKSVWKSRKNETTVCIRDIRNVVLIEKATPNFDIHKINPYHNEPDFDRIRQIQNSQTSKDDTKDLLSAVCSNITDNTVFLHIMPSLFCPAYYPSYDSSMNEEMVFEKVSVTVLYRNGDSNTYDDLKAKHVFPNHDYITACQKGKKHEGLLLSFETFEELQKVDGIGCSWCVKVGNNELKFTHIVYVSFEKHESYPIYNVVISTAPLEVHARSLTKPTVFSGRLYEEYTFAGISIDDEELIMILDDMDSRTTIDAAVVTHGSRENAISAFAHQEKSYTEIFIQQQAVNGLYYLSRHADGYTKRKINFEKVLKDRA